MEASERDTTDDWRIAPARAPATVVELEGRIDLALATARSAEEAAMEIGAASLEAAQQARRAAELAERASAAAARAAAEVAAVPRPAAIVSGEGPASVALAPASQAPVVEEDPAEAPVMTRGGPLQPQRRNDPFDERLAAFRKRAETVMVRLQKLEAGAAPGNGPSEIVRLR